MCWRFNARWTRAALPDWLRGLGAALAEALYGYIGAVSATGLIAWLLGMKLWLGLFDGGFLL